MLLLCSGILCTLLNIWLSILFWVYFIKHLTRKHSSKICLTIDSRAIPSHGKAIMCWENLLCMGLCIWTTDMCVISWTVSSPPVMKPAKPIQCLLWVWPIRTLELVTWPVNKEMEFDFIATSNFQENMLWPDLWPLDCPLDYYHDCLNSWLLHHFNSWSLGV